MELVRLIAGVLNALILLYVLVLLARLVMDYIPLFNREWRPKGALLVVAEIVYTITDPPLKLLRRVIPPLRIGPVAIDVAFALLMFACFLLLSITRAIAG